MKHRRRHMKKFSAEVLLESGKVDAVVAIGCLVKGSTRLMEACGLSWSTTLHFARAIVHNILTYLYLVFFLWLDGAYSCQLSGWSEIWETREFDWFIIESKQISDASTEKRIDQELLLRERTTVVWSMSSSISRVEPCHTWLVFRATSLGSILPHLQRYNLTSRAKRSITIGHFFKGTLL